MNAPTVLHPKLRAFAESYLLEGLAALPEDNQRTFRLMYGRNRGRRPVEASLEMALEDVVKEIPDNGLSIAMRQIDHTRQAKGL